VRSHARELGLDPQWFEENDVHVHVPAGAVPKDGPSAGITMAVAIVSIASGKPVSDDVAMTGEITLTGQVLGIGGVREKVLAAQRAGVHKVVVPGENEPDLEELPEESRKELEFVLADSIDQVLEVAFDGQLPAAAKPRSLTRERKAAASA
jgi:ATP-dependent Lon protease